MREIITAVFAALALCLVSGPLLIPFLRRLKFGQHIRSDGPKGHLQKAGTPTMGGVMFFISIPVGTLIGAGLTSSTAVLILATLGFGLIGFFDDFIKIVMKRPLGLRAREKILGQILISAIFAFIAVTYMGRGTEVSIPATSIVFDLGWLYLPFVVFIMISTTNAVNLTDGLDGLAAGVTLFAALAYLLISRSWGLAELGAFSGALAGTCLGFLFFNIHPARLFMGDTGSLALGGAICSLAVLTKTELLLPLIGLVYVLETFSVILQVIYFRLSRGRRLFRMSPLHHHFELGGWTEQVVVFFFWALAAFAAILALLLVI